MLDLDDTILYTCEKCGLTLMGMEWLEHSKTDNSVKCPGCGTTLDMDELEEH